MSNFYYIRAMVHELCDKAKIKYPKVVVRNMGMTAGMYDPRNHTVEINEQILQYPDHWTIVVHEVAHAVDQMRYGSRRNSRGQFIAHDDVFYGICRELGDPNPNRTHDYKLKPTRVYKEFEYNCACVEPHIVKTTTHNRITKKGMVYTCRKCSEPLRFVRQKT